VITIETVWWGIRFSSPTTNSSPYSQYTVVGWDGGKRNNKDFWIHCERLTKRQKHTSNSHQLIPHAPFSLSAWNQASPPRSLGTINLPYNRFSLWPFIIEQKPMWKKDIRVHAIEEVWTRNQTPSPQRPFGRESPWGSHGWTPCWPPPDLEAAHSTLPSSNLHMTNLTRALFGHALTLRVFNRHVRIGHTGGRELTPWWHASSKVR
jgi:hypothetical protein